MRTFSSKSQFVPFFLSGVQTEKRFDVATKGKCCYHNWLQPLHENTILPLSYIFFLTCPQVLKQESELKEGVKQAGDSTKKEALSSQLSTPSVRKKAKVIQGPKLTLKVLNF